MPKKQPKAKPKAGGFKDKILAPSSNRGLTFLFAFLISLAVPLLAGMVQAGLNYINNQDYYLPIETALDYALYGFLFACLFLLFKFRQSKFLTLGIFQNLAFKGVLAWSLLALVLGFVAFDILQDLSDRNQFMQSVASASQTNSNQDSKNQNNSSSDKDDSQQGSNSLINSLFDNPQAENSETNQNTEAINIAHHDLNGKIITNNGEALELVVNLGITGDLVSGYYKYPNQPDGKVDLIGRIKTNEVVLQSFVDNQSQGEFIGKAVIQDDKIKSVVGDFKAPQSQETASFYWNLATENNQPEPSQNQTQDYRRARVNQPACLIIREREGDRIGDYKYKNKDIACLPHRAEIRVYPAKGEVVSRIQNISSSGTYTFVYMEEVGGRNRSGWVAKEFIDFLD